MQACFNELSFEHKSEDEDSLQLFGSFAKTLKALKEKGVTKIRYEHGIGSLIRQDFRDITELTKTPVGKNIWQLIISFQDSPYLEPDSQAEERFINEDYETSIDGNWQQGQGFSSAFILNTFTVSLPTHPVWDNVKFDIRRKEETDPCGKVLNVNTEKAANHKEIMRLIEDSKPVLLESCNIHPSKKKFKVRDDHGKDKLALLWKKLCKNDYVVETINSLSFNSDSTKFIEKCFPDGKIHIRLVGSAKGYGMVIQTTGRDLKTTTAIAKIIEERYS